LRCNPWGPFGPDPVPRGKSGGPEEPESDPRDSCCDAVKNVPLPSLNPIHSN